MAHDTVDTRRDITAAVVREQGAAFIIEKATIGMPAAGEVLVKVVATGVCHTDAIIRGPILSLPSARCART